jgi:hypothetical protein
MTIQRPGFVSISFCIPKKKWSVQHWAKRRYADLVALCPSSVFARPEALQPQAKFDINTRSLSVLTP